MATLVPDKNLKFPEFVLLKASAGSGKTHALSLRFVQLLLSEKVKQATNSGLGNILAITFTRNAAREMKTRILAWLKECRFGDEKTAREILENVSIAPDQLPRLAEEAIEHILSNYSDFQVETIDSFMATIFKASAVDLGYSPDFEIVLDNKELVQYAFSKYLRNVTPHSEEGKIFTTIIDHILAYEKQDAAFPWDPTPDIQEKLIALYTKLASSGRELKTENFKSERAGLQKRMGRLATEIKKMIAESGLEPESRGHSHSRILPAIEGGRFADLLGCSFKTGPVKKPKRGSDQKNHEQILQSWGALEDVVKEYKSLYARDFFCPYLLAYRSLAGTLDGVKRRQGTVFIEDINKELAGYIKEGIVPDIYFRLGDRIFHYLIDEFQDTSRIQWANLKPLIEESLSKDGSLFVVGDTKQAIYGFRDADYEIMRDLERRETGFASVEVDPLELTKNHRSYEEVLRYVKKVFIKGKNKSDENDKYSSIAGRSGLNDFHQDVIAENKEKGYVEYIVLDKDPGKTPGKDASQEQIDLDNDLDSLDPDKIPGKQEIQNLVRELKKRGYSYSDIAILTYRNETVINVSSWLNEIGADFIPFSSLDIRMRKTIGEIMAFLQFLDSPPDDLSFSVFLLGDLFKRKMEQDGHLPAPGRWHRFLFECQRDEDYPLYTAFRKREPELWGRYFEQFFKTVGYYPLYDLVTLIYRVFNVFELFPREEAALTKLLEVIMVFEGLGRNDLREFLEFTRTGQDQESEWTIDIPSDIKAVRVMSVHKAKGLGFPVVVFLVYGERFRPPDFYIGEDEEHIRVYKLTKSLAESDEELRGIYEEARTKDDVERLNRLYVALTRAGAELYIVGVKGARDAYPFDLLTPAAMSLCQEKSNVTNLPEKRWISLGGNHFASASEKPAASPKAGGADTKCAEKMRFSGRFELPPNRRETLNYENIRRGEIAHRILAELEFLIAGWDEDVAGIIRKLGRQEAEKPLFDSVGSSLVRYFQSAPLTEYFEKKENRRVLREFDFCDASGAVYRMDRVVIDRDSVSVIDFKTGPQTGAPGRAEWERADREQVAAYVRIMREIFPEKSVRGILAYIDKNKWETVE